MKIFYLPQGLRCAACRAALWIEGEPTSDGKIIVRCIARHCARQDARMQVQLPSVDAKQIEE